LKIYFHKLNIYLNQTTTIQTFIIHLTYKDTWLFTSWRLMHWVRLRGLHLSYTIYLFWLAHISNLGYSLSRSVPISNLWYNSHMHKVNPYVLLIHMSYSDQLIFQTSDMAIWTSFDSSLTGKLHLYESNVPRESGYLLR